MGIEFPDGRLKEPEVETHDTLGNVLTRISEMYPDKMLNVIQLSCRAGDYDTSEVNELTRAFEAMELTSAEKIDDIKESDENLFHITEDKEEARRLSKEIKEQQKMRLKRIEQVKTEKRRTRKKQMRSHRKTLFANKRFEDIVNRAMTKTKMSKDRAIDYAYRIMSLKHPSSVSYVVESKLNLGEGIGKTKKRKTSKKRHKTRKHNTRKHKRSKKKHTKSKKK